MQGLHAIGLGRDRVLHLSLHKRSYRTSHLESSTCPFERLDATCSELISATVNANDISPISSPVSPPVYTIFMFLQRAASHSHIFPIDKHKTHCNSRIEKEREKKKQTCIPAIKNNIQHPPNPSLSSRDNTRNLTHSLTYFEHNPPKPHSCFHLPPGWHLPPPPIRNNTTQPPRVEDTPYPQPTSIPQNPPRLPACCTQPKPNQTTIPGSGNRKEENHANKGQIHLFRGGR